MPDRATGDPSAPRRAACFLPPHQRHQQRLDHINKGESMKLFGPTPKRTMRFGAVVVALAVGAAACGSSGNKDNASDAGTPSTAPAKGGTLTMAISNNPSSLDPQAGPSGTDHVVLYPLYDTLIDFDAKTLKPAPGLATEWSFTDPTTLQLKLRSGVKFSDGTAMDAAAVKGGLDRYKTQTNKADLANVTAIDAPDASTVVLHEKTPDSSLVLVLADRAGMVVS